MKLDEPELYGLLAEFTTPEALVAAARSATEAGYRQVEAYSPFPVEGIDEALARPGTVIPLLALVGGVLGALSAYAMEYYCLAIGYPLNVGGRPLNSWPSFMPIVFELTVLGGATFAFFGALVLNGFPHPYHPLFNVPQFKRASRDRFFLAIEAADPLFHVDPTRAFLTGLAAEGVYEVPA